MKKQGVVWSEQQYQEWLKRQEKPQPAISLFQAQKKPATASLAQKRYQKTKVETEFELILKAKFPEAKILYEAYTLKLAPYCHYTPDFALVEGQRVSFYEVKGPYVYDRALQKPKIAASLFKQHPFWLAQKTLAGWDLRQLPS